MTTKNKRKIINIMAIAMLLVASSSTVTALPTMAEEKQQAKTYCAEYYGDPSYDGSVTSGGVDASYYVYYDERVIVDEAHLFSVPSYGNANSAVYNACAVLAGANIVGYYDQWATNLMPNFEPGMQFPAGYMYYPDMKYDATVEMTYELYQLMNTNVGHLGTTSADFISGLDDYAENAGYDLSYYSMYSSPTSVNLNTLKTAINQGKVGLIMCSKYNYVSSISPSSAGYDYVAKWTYDIGHMMMVYGYQTLAYYQNGVNVKTATYLLVCSSYASGDKGFMEINSYSDIDEAYIMTIS